MFKRLGLILLYLMPFVTMVTGQESAVNPFTIPGRITEELVQPTEIQQSLNPFSFDHIKKSKSPSVIVKLPQAEKIIEKVDKVSFSNAALGMGLFFLFTIVFILFRDEIRSMFSSFINDKLFYQEQRAFHDFMEIPRVILYLFSLIVIASFVTYIGELRPNYFENSKQVFLIIFLGLLIYVVIKHVLLNTLSVLSKSSLNIEYYSSLFAIYNRVVGFLLLPLLLLMILSPTPMNIEISLYVGLVIIVLVYAYFFVRSFIANLSFLLRHKFHFMLYLCIVEISPVVLLMKLIPN